MADNKVPLHNIDGEEIDFTKDDLLEKLTYESANFVRRMIAYLMDLLIIIAIWYLCTNHLFKEIDEFVKNFASNDSDLTNLLKYEEFKNLFWELALKLFLAYVVVKVVYFTLVPAILGDGRSLGKLVAGIGVVGINTLEEISPTRLMLRELIGRGIIETVFVIPLFISALFAFFKEDSQSLHDMLAKTVVIKLDLYNIE